ncbi:hypothetical protein, partial [Streptomyces sp. NPDC057854]
MSTGQQYQQGQDQGSGSDPVGDILLLVLQGVAILLLGVVLLPLLVPSLVVALTFRHAPIKARYWLVPRWWVPLAVVGVLAVLAVLTW